MEDFWNQPKPKKPVPVAATKLPAVEDEEEENWENDLLWGRAGWRNGGRWGGKD